MGRHIIRRRARIWSDVEEFHISKAAESDAKSLIALLAILLGALADEWTSKRVGEEVDRMRSIKDIKERYSDPYLDYSQRRYSSVFPISESLSRLSKSMMHKRRMERKGAEIYPEKAPS